MKTENASSAVSSEPTSRSGPTTDQETKPSSNGPTEAQFLEAQAEKAKAAIAATVADLKSSLAKGLSPIEVAKEHPWISLGAGLVAGFAAASALVPSKEQQALNRLRRIEEALHRPSHDDAENNKAPGAGSQPSGIGATVLQHVLGMLRPILTTLVTSLISGQQQGHQPDPNQPADQNPADPSTTSA